MSDWGLSSTLRANRITQVKNAIDANGTAGAIKFYSGSQPATGGAITTQVLQCTTPMTYPCGAIAGATLTFGVAADGIRVAPDTITWARIVDGAGAFVMDGSVTVAGGGGNVLISAVNGPTGSYIRLISGILSD